MRDELITKAELDTTHERELVHPSWVDSYRAPFKYALHAELIRAVPTLEVEELLNRVTFAPYEDGTCQVFIAAGLDDRWHALLTDAVRKLAHVREIFVVDHSAKVSRSTEKEAPRSFEQFTPPRLGERVLLLVLRTREERVNIPGDLEEEYRGIAAKHGARYAKLWYYKQVVASAWPMVRKAVKWGALAWVGALIRRSF